MNKQTEEKKRLQYYIDSLVDKDGFQTNVVVTATNETLIKTALTLLATGISIALVAHLLKNVIVNKELKKQTALLTEISKKLK